jgi:hypothetical protein
MITTKNAEFRAMLTEATNASYDCGEYEFYAGEKVEDNYAELQEKAEVTRTKVIESFTELERENARIQSAYNELIYEVGTVHEGETRHETARRYIREREERVSDGPLSALPNVQAEPDAQHPR